MKEKGVSQVEFFVLVVFLVLAITIITYFAAFKTASPPQETPPGGGQGWEAKFPVQHLALNEGDVPGLFQQRVDKNISSKDFVDELKPVNSFQFEQFYSGRQRDFVAQSSRHSKDSYSVIKNLVAVITEKDGKEFIKKVRDDTSTEDLIDLGQIEGLERELGEEALLVNKTMGNLSYYQLHIRQGPLYSYLFLAGNNPPINDVLLYGISIDRKLKTGLSKIEEQSLGK